MSTIMFLFMIVFQLAGGLILIFGQVNIKDINFSTGSYYGSNNELDEQLKSEAISIYQIKYSNMFAGVFLVVGYMCSFGADYRLKNKFICACLSAVVAVVIALITRKIINHIAKNKQTIGLSKGAIWISDEEKSAD